MATLKTKLSKFDEVNKLPQNSKLHKILPVRNQIEQLSVDNVNNANNEMKPIFKQQNDMMNKIRATIALVYMEYASKGILQLNKIQMTNISTQIFKELENNVKVLGNAEVDKVTTILSNVYVNTYSKNSSILNLNLNTPSKDDIEKAVNTKIDGKLFSERIWDNKAKTVNILRKLVVNTLNGTMTIDDAGKQITKIFGVTANESYRLLVTEIMRVQAEASINIAKEAGLKKHMWSAKFENTCEFCQGQDGNIYAIDDTEAPEIPVHPYCKCLWINIPN